MRRFLSSNRFDLPSRHVLMTALAALLFFAALLPAFSPARAQLDPPLSLRDNDNSYDLAPEFFLLRDPGQKLDYKTVLERYRAGERGETLRSNVVGLGSHAGATWLVVAVSNDSWTEEWMLSFGGSLTGRLGQLSKIFVYDDLSRTRYIDTVTVANNPYLAEGAMMGSALPLKLARGKKALLVMYIAPEPGVPVVITPRLVTAASYMKALTAPFNPGRLLVAGFMVMIGFFVGTLLFRRMWSGAAFIVYYTLLMILFQMQNDLVFTKFALASELFALMTGLMVVTGIVMAATFLDIRRFYRVQNKAMTGFCVGIVIASLAGAFIVGDQSAAKPILLLLPSFLGTIFIVLLGLAQAHSGKYAANQFALSWFCVVIGSILSLLTIAGIITPNPLLVGAFWYSLIPQALLFVSATVTREMLRERDEDLLSEEKNKEADAIALLRQTRESSENARLLRVIEHEREVMNELRDREIRQNEDMRLARDAADEANRAKSAFLAVISHEIRTPMSGIMGMVRLLLDTKLSPEQRDYTQTIQDSGDAMLSLLNDILDFEKIESGKMDLEHIDFDLPRLIQGIVTLMSGHAETKGLTLKADIDPALPRFVVGDPVRLRQVLLNLVGNSIKFTEFGGVTIHIKSDHGTDTRQGMARIRIAVQDTGVGVSREAQKNLFNPFAQADSSVARRFGGTGLGLAISQRLIEALGGRIAIDSTEGRGSTFYFTLMVEEGSAENAQTIRGAVGGARPEKVMRILVVEDNEINQKLMKEFVQRMGHEVTLSGSGEDGLRQIGERDFDMVMMDIELPGISGMGATKAIRALPDRQKAALPVIAMTGNVRDEDVRNCYAANMNGHLAKPVEPQKLREAIDKVIARKLDNPVVLEEVDETYIRPQETEIALSVDTLAAASTLGLEGEGRKGGAPVRDMMPDMTAFALDEGELDEDSFSAAIERHGGGETEEEPRAVVFDAALLDGLRERMNALTLGQLIEEMLGKSAQIIGDMAGAQDAEALGARAHELKGMTANFGLVELSGLAGRIEDGVRARDSAASKAAAAELVPALGRAQGALRAWLQEGRAAE